jgi:hypothetical protein
MPQGKKKARVMLNIVAVLGSNIQCMFNASSSALINDG